jgi:aminomethyltransferase
MAQLKSTPLHATHVALGAKMVPFAGYDMPVQYPSGILAEHQAVRANVGLFDISHMGELEITGPDRDAFVNRVTCNDVRLVKPGGVQYSAILTPVGTFVDDCTLYRFEDRWVIVVNASNIAAAWQHLMSRIGGADVQLRDLSDNIGLLALQGPRAEAVLQPLTGACLADLAYYHFVVGDVAGVECWISRTGYTGEDGFELYCTAGSTGALWEALTAAGAPPIGLGARDLLRLEMGYSLYGHEIDRTVTPLEAGLGWIVKLDKGTPFVGDAVLRAQNQQGVGRKLAAFRLEGRGIPRQGYPVWFEGRQVDQVRSGGLSPSLNAPIGTTFLPREAAVPGTKFEVEVRGERLPITCKPARTPTCGRSGQ